MEVNGAEQYRRADIIIDAVCNVGNITYMDFVTEKHYIKELETMFLNREADYGDKKNV